MHEFHFLSEYFKIFFLPLQFNFSRYLVINLERLSSTGIHVRGTVRVREHDETVEIAQGREDEEIWFNGEVSGW